MAISIGWADKVIYVPKSYLSALGGEVYELNVDTFRLDLKELEDDEEGMVFPRTHNHNTPVTVAGVTIARVVEIINDYTITFEDGQYAVKLTSANTNIADVTNINQVSIRSNNTAGLIQVDTGGGSGGSGPTAAAIADAVLDEQMSGHVTAGSFGKKIADLPANTVAALKAETFDTVAFDDIVKDILSYVSGKIIKVADNTFEYYNRAGGSVRFTLTENGVQRTRS